MLSEIPQAIRLEVKNILNEKLKEFSFSGGGCINHGGKLATTLGDFFLKWNSALRFPGMFEAEARGLQLLRNPSVIHVPNVIAVGNAEDFQFLLLEFVEAKPNTANYWEMLGEQLANLHRVSNENFGLDYDNYIGSLPQVNEREKNWIDFFIQKRLNIQVQMAVDAAKIPVSIEKQFSILYNKLPSLLPSEKPSLLHGDLWSGNLITNAEGAPCLIDPATYFGHREIELAFTELFGGFSERFYDSYNSHFKLQSGYSERKALYQLYPLMVHVNLFGGGYVSQVVSILKKFV